MLGPDVAVDRTRTHPGACTDGAQRRTIEALLAEEFAGSGADPRPTATAPGEKMVVDPELMMKAIARGAQVNTDLSDNWGG